MIFSLELEISGVTVQIIHQNSEKWWRCEDLVTENDFQAILAIGANVSEAVQKIATDQKDYHKCSSRVIVC